MLCALQINAIYSDCRNNVPISESSAVDKRRMVASADRIHTHNQKEYVYDIYYKYENGIPGSHDILLSGDFKMPGGIDAISLHPVVDGHPGNSEQIRGF